MDDRRGHSQAKTESNRLEHWELDRGKMRPSNREPRSDETVFNTLCVTCKLYDDDYDFKATIASCGWRHRWSRNSTTVKMLTERMRRCWNWKRVKTHTFKKLGKVQHKLMTWLCSSMDESSFSSSSSLYFAGQWRLWQRVGKASTPWRSLTFSRWTPIEGHPVRPAVNHISIANDRTSTWSCLGKTWNIIYVDAQIGLVNQVVFGFNYFVFDIFGVNSEFLFIPKLIRVQDCPGSSK